MDFKHSLNHVASIGAEESIISSSVAALDPRGWLSTAPPLPLASRLDDGLCFRIRLRETFHCR